jgi:hypothetical protein
MSKCGSIEDVQRVYFNDMLISTVGWDTVFLAHVEMWEQENNALQLPQQIQQSLSHSLWPYAHAEFKWHYASVHIHTQVV